MYVANDCIMEYNWFSEKLFDIEEFNDTLKNFKNHLENYLFQNLDIQLKQQVKKEFDILLSDFFGKIGLDIKFDDIAILNFDEGFSVYPKRNLTSFIFFSNEREKKWNEFIHLCKIKDKKKLLKKE